MATTPVFSPQGQFGYVSPDQLDNALASGGKRAVPMLNPQGQRGWVPEDMVDDARKKGGVLASEPGQSPTELANQALAGTGISVNPPAQPLKTMHREGAITGSTFTLPGNVDVSNPGGPTIAQQRQAALARRTPEQQAQVVKAIAQEAPLNLTGLDLGNAAVGAKNLATKGHRAEGAAQVLGAAGNTMAPAIGPGAIEAPVATALGMGTGLLAGKGARKLVQAGGGGQGAQDLAEQGTNLFVPSLLSLLGMGGGKPAEAEAKAQEALVPADEAINNAATKTGEIVKAIPSAARNNPVTNLALGPNPNAIEPVQALTKAVRPRNSIQNFSEHAGRALPDARRAADTLGIDTNSMTLKDAEDAVVQGKKDVWNEFQQNHLNPVKDVGVDASPIAARIQQVANGMTDIQKGRMGPLVDQIQNAAADYAGKTMSVGDIESRLQEVNNELRSQQAQFKVNEMNLRNDPRFAYKYAELDGLRQAERQAFDNMTGPGAADLKQRYGSLKVMEDVLDRRINVADRANVSKLYETGGRMAGIGDVLKGIGAREPLTIGAGVMKMRMGKNAQQLNDPDFLIQQAFSKTTPRPQPGINGNLPIIRGQLPSPVPGLNGYVYGSQPTSPDMITPATPSKVNVEPTTRAQRLGLLLPQGPTDWEGKPFNNELAAPEPPQGGTQRANFVVQRDPRTGRMVKMYVTSGGGKQLGPQSEEAAPAEQQSNPLQALSPKAGAVQGAANVLGKRARSQGGFANIGMFVPGVRVGERVPTAVKATEVGHDPDLSIDRSVIENSPNDLAGKIAGKLKDYDSFKPTNPKNPKQVFTDFINHVANNLVALHDQIPPDVRDRWAKWYDTAHQMSQDLGQQYGYAHHQVAGAIASLSPQTDWYVNLSRAKRVLDINTNQGDFAWDKAMDNKFRELTPRDETTGEPKNPVLKALYRDIKGKTYSQLTDDVQRAAWLRVYDEAHNDSSYHAYDSLGNDLGKKVNQSGKDAKVSWGSLNEIGKAISILRDGSPENISQNLGAQHKVRNFYNNIADPNSPKGDVTIDTHAVGAGLLKMVSGKSHEVGENFGSSGSSNVTGANGTYGLYADAYRQAAKQLGIKPRELQSITWEAIREMFPNKSEENAGKINAIWKDYKRGRRSLQDAQTAVIDEARKQLGDAAPEWLQRSSSGVDAEKGNPDNAAELSRRGVPGESTGQALGGRGGRVAPIAPNFGSRPGFAPAAGISKIPPMMIPGLVAGGAALAGYAHKKLKQAPSPLPFLRK